MIITTIIVRIAVYHLSKAYYMPGSVIEGSLILTTISLGFYQPHLQMRKTEVNGLFEVTE